MNIYVACKILRMIKFLKDPMCRSTGLIKLVARKGTIQEHKCLEENKKTQKWS